MSANDAIENVGEKLLAALTYAEIERLLDALWAESSDQWEGAIAHLSLDTQVTVRQLIAQPLPDHSSPDPEAPIAIAQLSHAKLAQIWSELWQEWLALVAVASEEDGRYIAQEASWEQPYFDDYAFAEELDAVAAKMRSLLPAAFEQGLFPEEGFAPALIKAEAEISAGIPDWMAFIEGIGLGEQVTHCLLAWEWLTIQAQGQDGYQFAQRIRAIDSELAQMSLDDNELTDFLWELPQAEQSCLVAGITEHKDTDLWKAVLGNTTSAWYLYYMEKASESSPKDYLNNLRETIPQKWNNGLLVIESLLADEDYAEGLMVIQETLVAMLKSRYQGQPWTPETSLLVTLVAGYSYEQDFFEHAKTLLSYWQTIAEALGQAKRVNALKVQQLAFDDCFNWQKMFKTFADISVAAPSVSKAHQALFQSWRAYVVQRATPRSFAYGHASSTESGWLHWLIDSIAEPKKGAQWFQKKMSKWIKGLAGDRHSLAPSMGSEFDLLRLLTRDLQATQPDQQKVYPNFNKVVIRGKELSAPDDASRQAYLRQFASADLWSQVMAYWQANLHQFVPDPQSVQKSDYTPHARWLLALKEISPSAHATLLAQWKTEHLRRSNLWKAIAKADK